MERPFWARVLKPKKTQIYLLSTRELELGSTKSLETSSHMVLLWPNRHDHLPNINSSHCTLWFTKRSSHPCLEPAWLNIPLHHSEREWHHHSPISSGTRQHFVDAQHVKWVESYPNMELVFPGMFDHVLVGTDPTCLQSLTGQLLIFIGDKMNTGWEYVHWHSLWTQVKYPYLCIWSDHEVVEEREGCGYQKPRRGGKIR